MSTDPTSLDALRDIAMPAPVPWWPPAPGWYVVLGLALLATLLAAWRAWRHWRANAYRREAIRALGGLDPRDLAAHAELVRRTALADEPRATVATLDGNAWVEFLVSRCPAVGREEWAWLHDIYRARTTAPADVAGTVRRWILTHQPGKEASC